MGHTDNVIDMNKPVEFTIDGRPYSSRHRKRRAADLLELAGLDADRYELWEMRLYRPTPLRYLADDIVGIRAGARFVSISESVRDRAGVAHEADL